MQNFMGIMMHFVRIFFEGGKLPGFAPQGGNIIFLKYGHNFFSGHFMKKLRTLSFQNANSTFSTLVKKTLLIFRFL